MKKTLLLVLLLATNLLPAQTPIHTIPGPLSSRIEPADMDNDGLMDIASDWVGPLWLRNSGDTAFTRLQSNIWWYPNYSTFDLGDADGDSDLDMLYASESSSGWSSLIFRPTPTGLFSNGANLNLPGNFYSGAIKWIDFDQDGDRDVFGTGYNGQDYVTGLWEFENGHFTPSSSSFNQLDGATFVFFDLENDGDLDLAQSGYITINFNTGPITEIYRNDNGIYQKQDNATLPGINAAVLQSADLNHDGRADLIIGGAASTWPTPPKSVVSIYLNTGNGTFNLKQTVEVPTTALGDVGPILVADLDNNGTRDIVLYYPTGMISQGAGGVWQFSETALGLPNYGGFLRLADFDHDLKLDLMLYTNGHPIANNERVEIYANPFPNPAKRPNPPKNLTYDVLEGAVRFNWTAGSDDRTPPSSLRYNARIGTAPGLGDIVACDSDTSGRRLMFSDGNVPGGKSFTLRGLTGGTYWFSVQSIDGHLLGSTFETIPFSITPTLAAPTIFYPQDGAVDVPVFSNAAWDFVQNAQQYEVQVATDLLFQNIVYQKTLTENEDTLAFPDCDSIYYWRVRGLAAGYLSTWSPVFSARTMEAFTQVWGVDLTGDFFPADVKFVHLDNDKRIDVAVMGTKGDNFQNFVVTVFTFTRNPDGQFQQIWQSDVFFPQTQNGIIWSWVDRDLDGDMDFYLPGFESEEASFFKNLGNGQFQHVPGYEIPGARGQTAWFDADNDNDPDAVVPQGCGDAKLVRPDPNSGNSLISDLNFCTIGGASVETFDFNNDGLQDIFLTGKVVWAGLAKNDGTLNFPLVNTGDFEWAQNGDTESADIDGDGDLDLLSVGYHQDWQVYVYENTNGYFFLRQNITSPWFTSVSMADFDLDGDPDLLLNGWAAPGLPNYPGWVYKNNAGFFEPFFKLDYNCGGMDVADVDGDGDSDFACGGVIFRNNEGRNIEVPPGLSPPEAPSMLTANVAGNTVYLSFQADMNRGLNSTATRFNLRVGKSPGAANVVSPLANPATGQTYLSQTGNAGTSGNYPLKNLAAGTYFWSVQSIAADLIGSPFAQEQSFTVGPVPTNEAVAPLGLRVFPNPASDAVLVEWPFSAGGGRIRIVDALGKTVFEQDIQLDASGIQRIDVQNFEDNIYFLQVVSEGRVAGVGRFVKVSPK